MNHDDDQDPISEEADGQEPQTLAYFLPDSDVDESADFWSGEDLERAYQQALSALDQLEAAIPSAREALDFDASREETEDETGPVLHPFPGTAVKKSTSETTASNSDHAPVVQVGPRIQPAKIIEAALFVGGMPLTVKKLSSILRDEFDREFIERMIDELNLRYDDENRPYEIRLDEGGYQMVLRPEFEGVRNKTYGFGPKEVRLSQEALEVLALVAYKQPITKEQIEASGKPHPNAVLRQLLRREIIALKRNGNSASDVTYHTTPRFLQIFGLADLEELPRAEDLSFK